MALVPVRVDRTSKPPLGTPLRSDGHWSVQGLVGAWAFNEGAGKSVVDSCGIAQLGSLGSTTKFAPGGIKYGSTGSNTDRVVIPANPMQSLLSFTIITAITLFASESNSGFCTRGGLTLGLYYNASGMGAFRYAGVALGYTPAINTRYILGVVQKGGAGTPWEAYIGGRKVAAGSYAVAPYGSVSEWIFGNTSLTGYSSSGCLQDFVLLHNHAKFTPQQISSLSANPWQIYEPETVWIEVGGGGEAALFAGTIYGQSSASAQLSTAITIASQVVAGGSISGGINTAIRLATSTQGTAFSSALLTTAIRMAASAQGYGSSTADLSTTIALAADILATSSASGALSTAIRLGGALSGSSTTTAALTNAITMAAQAAGLGAITGQLAGTVAAALFAGTISGSSSASANLSTAVVLAAAAQGSATAQAALSTALELASQVNGIGTASGALGADISGLSGSLHGSSEAQATLATAIHLMGVAAGQCVVTGRLAEPVEILAQLRVMASDPLALTISVRDPLALRVTVQ